MHGFRVFLAKEIREIFRTWRMWVLPAIVLGMGLLSPVTAKITPALVRSVAGDTPGLVLEIPDPTTVDAYLQWTKNLAQIVLLAVIISTAGTIASERKNGTAVLVLTKPLSRRAMVVAKMIGNTLLLIGATVLGAAVCFAGTAAFFDSGHASDFLAATALWVVLATLFLALMTFLSVALKSQAGAAGLGLVAYLVMAVLSAWGPARDYSPAGLLSAGDALLTGGDPSILWPVVTTLVAAVVVVALAAWLFQRVEL